MIKVEATYRLTAMPVHQGDNFSSGKQLAYNMLKEDAMDFVQLARKGSFSLLKVVFSTWITYLVVELSSKFQPQPDQKLREFVKSIVGFMEVRSKGSKFKNADKVLSIWVDPSYRGGFGKALYMTAYKYSANGIVSSDDLGTLSLAAWLSLYKQFKKIQLVIEPYQSEFVYANRKLLKIEGLNMTYPLDGEELSLVTHKDLPIFYFVWPK